MEDKARCINSIGKTFTFPPQASGFGQNFWESHAPPLLCGRWFVSIQRHRKMSSHLELYLTKRLLCFWRKCWSRNATKLLKEEGIQEAHNDDCQICTSSGIQASLAKHLHQLGPVPKLSSERKTRKQSAQTLTTVQISEKDCNKKTIAQPGFRTPKRRRE
jgi:hypothetical protein